MLLGRLGVSGMGRLVVMSGSNNPDMVAAGQDIITGFGDKGINSSIGAQWKGRVSDLDNDACKEQKAGKGKHKMNAKLTRCKK